MTNISQYEDNKTARTRSACARQRAENLAVLGVDSVIELCVGPSLQALEGAYKAVGIQTVAGNDIDPRWRDYYPLGSWIIGDATKVDASGFDAVVFAPPLSKGCSGTRKDSLSVDEVFPAYRDILQSKARVLTLVLPGRTLSIREDREQLHGLVSDIHRFRPGSIVDVVPLKDERGRVTKYVDVYIVGKQKHGHY